MHGYWLSLYCIGLHRTHVVQVLQTLLRQHADDPINSFNDIQNDIDKDNISILFGGLVICDTWGQAQNAAMWRGLETNYKRNETTSTRAKSSSLKKMWWLTYASDHPTKTTSRICTQEYVAGMASIIIQCLIITYLSSSNCMALSMFTSEVLASWERNINILSSTSQSQTVNVANTTPSPDNIQSHDNEDDDNIPDDFDQAFDMIIIFSNFIHGEHRQLYKKLWFYNKENSKIYMIVMIVSICAYRRNRLDFINLWHSCVTHLKGTLWTIQPIVFLSLILELHWYRLFLNIVIIILSI